MGVIGLTVLGYCRNNGFAKWWTHRTDTFFAYKRLMERNSSKFRT